MKTKHLKKRWIILILILFAVSTCLSEYLYHQKKVKAFEEEKAFLTDVQETEKTWIKKNQGSDGQIYLNLGTGAAAAGDVNPYFACQAAAGLLADPVSTEDFSAVHRYLNWHIQHLIAGNGIITEYKLENGILVSTGIYDSVDSYIAVFLSLTAAYQEAGGSLKELNELDQALQLSFLRLRELQHDGITYVSSEKHVTYLMDNAEVFDGCRRIAASLRAEEIDTLLAEQFASFAEDISSSFSDMFWNTESQRYEIGIDDNGNVIAFNGWDDFYPSAVSQLYPFIYSLQDSKGAKVLYKKINAADDWQNMKLNTEFEWPMMAYAAARLNDLQSADQYLRNYAEKYKDERNYPFHTAVSGWAAMTCSVLTEAGQENLRKGILQDFLS